LPFVKGDNSLVTETTPEVMEVQPVTGVAGMLARLMTLRQNKEVGRFLKFAVVGVIGALIDSGAFNLLRAVSWLEAVQIHFPGGQVLSREVEAGAIAFLLAVSSNFIWNRFWTYPDSRSKPIFSQMATFFGINMMGLFIRVLVLQFGSPPLSAIAHGIIPSLRPSTAASIGANAAWAISVIIVMFWNFFVNRYCTYNDVT
jgi:putative flippase GtrA